MKPTTIKLSTETRDRLRDLGGKTLRGHDHRSPRPAREREFWAQADRAAAWRASLPADERAEVEHREAALDAQLHGLR